MTGFMTLHDFAVSMGIGDGKAREIMAGSNHPPAMRIGGKWRIDREGAEEWRLAQLKTGPGVVDL